MTDTSTSFKLPGVSFKLKKDAKEDTTGASVLKEGYLLKEGKLVKSWKTRFFQVKSNKKLYYYEKRDGKLLGSFNLEGMIMSEAPERKFDNCFKVSTGERVWYLRANSSEEMFGWIDAIRDFGGAKETLPDLPTDHLKKKNDIETDFSDFTASSDFDDEEEVVNHEKKKKKLRKKKNAPATVVTPPTIAVEQPVLPIENVDSTIEGEQPKVEPKTETITPPPAQDEISEYETDTDVETESDDDGVRKQKTGDASMSFILEDEEDDFKDAEEYGSDTSYNSDNEMWDMLKNNRNITPQKGPNDKKRPAKKPVQAKPQAQAVEAPKPTAEPVNSLFSFFMAETEKKVEAKEATNAAPVNPEVPKAPTRHRLAASRKKQIDPLNNAFKSISVIPDDHTSSTLLEEKSIEQVKRDLKRHQHEAELERYVTPDQPEQTVPVAAEEDEDEEEGLPHTRIGVTGENDFDDLVEQENVQQTPREKKKQGFTLKRGYNETASVFSKRATNPIVYLFACFMVWVVATVTYVGYHWSRDQMVSKTSSEETNGDSDGYVVFMICEYFNHIIYDYFHQVLFIISCMETALSEVGAFLYGSITESSDILVSSGYVGRIIQSGIFASFLFSLLLFALNTSSIGAFMRGSIPAGEAVIGETGPTRALYYMFTRSPVMFLHLLWSSFQGTLYGTLRMWEWFAMSCGMAVFFFLCILFFQAVVPDKMFSMAAAYDLVIILAIIASIIAYARRRFRVKHAMNDWSQDKQTVSRYATRTIALLLCGLVPTAMQYMTMTLVFRRGSAEMFGYLAVTQPLTIFMQFGRMQNGVALAVGTRSVKRLQYRPYIVMMVKSVLCAIGFGMLVACLFIFTNLREMCVGQVAHPLLFIPDQPPGNIEEIKMIRDAAEPLWKMAYFGLPLALLTNLYQFFLLNFECYWYVAVITAAVNTLVVLPGVLISLLAVNTTRGIFITFMAADLIALIIFIIYLHGWQLPALNKQFLELTAKQNVAKEEDENSANELGSNTGTLEDDESDVGDDEPLLSQEENLNKRASRRF